MPENEKRENGTATEEGTATQTTAASPTNGGSSNVSRGVKTALIATAVGTAVAAATRARSGSSPTGGGEAPESETAGSVKDRFDRASKRGEPFITAAWDAGKDSFEPLTRHGARQAGRFLAQRSPDFVRETIIPPFVEGLTEDQGSSSA